MSEYQRVTVTADDLPKMKLTGEFISLDSAGGFTIERGPVTLIADADEVTEYVETVGVDEGWDDHVETIDAEPIDDPESLPDHIENVVTDQAFRVWEYASELLPSGSELDEFLVQGNVKFTVTDRDDSEKTYLRPVSTDKLQEWADDEEFGFSLNEEQEGFTAAEVIGLENALVEDFPGVRMYGTGNLMGPTKFEPHGSAVLDGFAVTMQSSESISDAVVEWMKGRVEGEFDVRETESGEWVIAQWD